MQYIPVLIHFFDKNKQRMDFFEACDEGWVMRGEWWGESDEAEWWGESDEGWVMSEDWWVMNDNNK